MNNFPTYKKDFPIFETMHHGQPLEYLDNAATAQIPRAVANAVKDRLFSINANVHRGIYRLSEDSTRSYENARQYIADYLNAERQEIVFTSGTTHSINLVAASIGDTLKSGDKIVTTMMEHHSNFVPWQQICQKSGADFCVVSLNENGELNERDLTSRLDKKTRLLAVTQCSNVTGAFNDIPRICSIAHSLGIPVLVDGAQGIAHSHPDMAQLGCDYYCFSAHKIMGLTGTGILFAKKPFMEKLRPFQFGGGMVKTSDVHGTEFEKYPYALEAGTPNFVGATALWAALAYRQSLNEEILFSKEQMLLEQARNGLKQMPRVKILGNPALQKGCLSFTVKNAHPFDIAMLLDQKGIAVRSGHHCALPLLKFFGCEYAVRISPAFYNDPEEIHFFLQTLQQILKIL